MNANIIRNTCQICAVFAFYLCVAMIIPATLDFHASNPDWKVFALSSIVIGMPAALLATATQGSTPSTSTRFTFLVVNMLWITFAFVGAVPLILSSIELSWADAIFESMSGITTTGSTVLTGLDSMPPGILIWRSMLQWFGGLGVIALGLFILPFLKIGTSSMFKIESSDKADRPFARFSTFARSMISIYIATTVTCALLYWIGGMSVFDAINHAFTTLSTGGFSTHDASFGAFDSLFLQWVCIIFMLIGALPFTALILLAIKRRIDTFKDRQIAVMLGYTVALSILLTAYLDFSGVTDGRHALTPATFSIVSLITTTGFGTTDYIPWGPFALALIFCATLLGGCSGSTAGGIKAYRWMIAFSMIRRSIDTFVYPHTIRSIKFGGMAVNAEAQMVTVLFFTTYFLAAFAGTVALTFYGMDFLGAFGAALTALSNVGPGFTEATGPAGNFANISDGAKWCMTVLMLLGRLELFTVLVLLSPSFWRG